MARQGQEQRELEVGTDWHYGSGEGSGREQLLATRLMLSALAGAPLELYRPDGQWLARRE